MKRILLVLLSLVLVVSLAACGEGGGNKDLFARYEASIKKQEDIKSMEVVMDMKMTITADGQTETMDVTMSQKQLMGDTVKAIMVMDMPAAGMTNAKVYLPGDDSMYYDVSGQKFKVNVGIEEMVKQIEANSTGVEFGKEDMSKVEAEELDNGNTKLTFHLKDTAADKIMGDAMSTMTNALPLEEEGMEISASNIIYALELDKEDNMQAFNMSMDMSLTIQGEKADTTIEMDADIVSINAFDSLEFPDDLDDYQEMTL